jgi:hypothetical protein
VIVGLTGFAGSGKDTVAEILVQEHGFKRYAFADKLREMAYAINPIIVCRGINYRLAELVDAYGWDKAKREIAGVREFLQDLGVWHRDNVSEDFWVGLVAKKVSDEFPLRFVITDVRFPNEARWVREQWGQVWRVTRPGVGPINDHVSEKLDLAADNTILNNGSLLHLRELVWELMKGEEQAA